MIIPHNDSEDMTELVDLSNANEELPYNSFIRECEAIVQNGKRKGEKCKCTVLVNSLTQPFLCGRHNRPKIKRIPQKDTCSICYEEMTLGCKKTKCLENCGHNFHKKCLQNWINQDKATCPLCRTPLKVRHYYIYC